MAKRKPIPEIHDDSITTEVTVARDPRFCSTYTVTDRKGVVIGWISAETIRDLSADLKARGVDP